ncbi:hypothetical protein RSG62_003523, partial [Yersinia enterocolitica]|nr:hypothetical protein [Yersinia enterocolitica]
LKLEYGNRKPFLLFDSEDNFFEALGFLAKAVALGICRITLENNHEQGAWGPEYRINIYNHDVLFRKYYKNKVTAGNKGCIGRINCNEYMIFIVENHQFTINGNVNINNIRGTVPLSGIVSFDTGVNNAG